MNVIYEAFFVIDTLNSTLEKDIEFKHITTEFRPVITHEHLYGKEIIIQVIGYGNDNENEGYLVHLLSCEDEELQELFHQNAIPHITLSTSIDGKPMNTSKLEFKPIDSFIIKCKFGGYLGKPIFNIQQ